VAETFADWAPLVHEILEATPPEDIVERPIEDRTPLAHWSSGRNVVSQVANGGLTQNIAASAPVIARTASSTRVASPTTVVTPSGSAARFGCERATAEQNRPSAWTSPIR